MKAIVLILVIFAIAVGATAVAMAVRGHPGYALLTVIVGFVLLDEARIRA